MTRPAVLLPDDLRREIIAHCVAGAPYEACGLLAQDGNRVAAVYPTTNAARSGIAYTVSPEEHIEALIDAEARGWVLSGVFHSHPGGSAMPSATDIREALEPQWLYVIVGLGGGEPDVRGWWIVDGAAEEAALA